MAVQTYTTTLPEDFEDERTALRKLCQAASSGVLPPGADHVTYAYFGTTNNIQTATYRRGGAGGTVVGTLTFTYIGGGAADNDRVATVALT